MKREVLKSNIIYTDVIEDIICDMKNQNINLDSNTLVIPKFEIKQIRHVRKPTFKVDFVKRKKDDMLIIESRVVCKFVGKLNIAYKIKGSSSFSAKMTDENSSHLERDLKTYTYAYLKRMLESNKTIQMIRPSDLVFPAISLISGKQLFTKEMREDHVLTSPSFKSHDMEVFVHQEKKMMERDKTFSDEEIRKYNEIINSYM